MEKPAIKELMRFIANLIVTIIAAMVIFSWQNSSNKVNNSATKQELKDVVIDYKAADEKINDKLEGKVDKSDFKEIKDQIKFLYEEEVKKANRR